MQTVTLFTLLYRQCANQYGWQKLAECDLREIKSSLDDANVKQRMLLRSDQQAAFDFCECNNAECLPEICNEFCTMFMQARISLVGSQISEQQLVDLTRHLCNWLFM